MIFDGSNYRRKRAPSRQEMIFHRHFRYLIPLLLWMGIIFWMSTETFSSENTSMLIEPAIRYLMPSISPEKTGMIHAAIRRLAHFTEYFILGILLFRFFRGGSKELRTRRWAFYSVLLIAFYAAGDEFHQSFVSSRTASLLDIGLDTLGGIVAQGVSAVRLISRQ
jgi:VanZ family protein